VEVKGRSSCCFGHFGCEDKRPSLSLLGVCLSYMRHKSLYKGRVVGLAMYEKKLGLGRCAAMGRAVCDHHGAR
jgi:hypothetical protein